MKKRFLQATALLGLLMLAVSCQDPLAPDPVSGEQASSNNGKMTIRASIEQRSPESKTVIQGLNIYWSEGDKIRVYNSDNPDGVVFTRKSGTGNTADFEGDIISGSGPYYIVYPADAAGSLSGSRVAFNVSSSQAYVSNSFALGSSIAAGYSATLEDIKLRNVGGVLKFSLSGDATIKKINVYTRGSERLCGAAGIDIPSSGDPTLVFDSGQDASYLRCVTLDCGAGVSISGGNDFYVSLPAGAFAASGFYLEAVDSQGNAMLKYSSSAADENTINRSHIRSMSTLTYNPQYRAAFLLPESVEAGGFTGVEKDETCNTCCSYVRGVGQYAYTIGAETQTFRIQDWTSGFALVLAMPRAITPGSKANVTVTASGETGGIASGSAEMRVLKKMGHRVWLANGSTGFIMFVEE